MSKLVLDPPAVEPPVERATQTPVELSPNVDSSTRASQGGAGSNAAERERKTWLLGAHLTIGAVAIFLLAMLAIIAVFSVPSASLFTVDGAIALGIIVLSIALSMLLAVANSRQVA